MRKWMLINTECITQGNLGSSTVKIRIEICLIPKSKIFWPLYYRDTHVCFPSLTLCGLGWRKGTDLPSGRAALYCTAPAEEIRLRSHQPWSWDPWICLYPQPRKWRGHNRCSEPACEQAGKLWGHSRNSGSQRIGGGRLRQGRRGEGREWERGMEGRENSAKPATCTGALSSLSKALWGSHFHIGHVILTALNSDHKSSHKDVHCFICFKDDSKDIIIHLGNSFYRYFFNEWNWPNYAMYIYKYATVNFAFKRNRGR